MLDAVREKSLIRSPKHVPEMKLYCLAPDVFEYPYLVNDYNSMFGYPTWAGIALSRYVLDHAVTFAGKTISDVGCGSGIASIAAKMAGADVVSIDRDVAALYFTSENFLLNNLEANTVWGSFAQVQGDFVMISSLFYDAVNQNKIEELVRTQKVMIGCFNTQPASLAGLHRADVGLGGDFYVLTNFQL